MGVRTVSRRRGCRVIFHGSRPCRARGFVEDLSHLSWAMAGEGRPNAVGWPTTGLRGACARARRLSLQNLRPCSSGG